MKGEATRRAFGRVLASLGKERSDIVVLDADISKSTCTGDFAAAFPDRAFNLGVAEQNMMGVAAGLASAGKIPFACTYAVFASMRACEQVRTFIAYPYLNVKIAASHGGLSVGWDGVTHQGTEDIAMMRAIPGMTVLSPADSPSTEEAVRAAVAHEGPVYLRLTRNPTSILYERPFSFAIGKAHQLADGLDLTIVATGVMVAEARRALDLLAVDGISARLMDMSTIKPLDRAAIIRAAEETAALVTCEDHQMFGGLGSAVAEVLCETRPVPLERVALRDTFGESGDPVALFEKYGLSAGHIADAARRVLARKR